MSRDGGDTKEGISRRGFVKGALAMGVAGAAVAGGAAGLRSLIGDHRPDIQETFLYLNAEGARQPAWWVDRGLVGKRARFSHFERGTGANVLWRWYADANRNIAGGASALLMRVHEENLEFPQGYAPDEFVVRGLYAVFNCCTHACCRPGWQLVPRSEYGHDLGYDTIFCPCHCAQFHPTHIGKFRHPSPPEASGATYLGVTNVAGPANRGMPLIPVEVQDDVILGKLRDPEWYRYLDTKNRPLL